MSWENLDKTRADSVHYSVLKLSDASTGGMSALRDMFPLGIADSLNFVLFSTSGVHGHYQTIEEAETGFDDPMVTFLVVNPRLVALRYGNCSPQSAGDFEFLKKLRQSSWEVAAQIGASS